MVELDEEAGTLLGLRMPVDVDVCLEGIASVDVDVGGHCRWGNILVETGFGACRNSVVDTFFWTTLLNLIDAVAKKLVDELNPVRFDDEPSWTLLLDEDTKRASVGDVDLRWVWPRFAIRRAGTVGRRGLLSKRMGAEMDGRCFGGTLDWAFELGAVVEGVMGKRAIDLRGPAIGATDVRGPTDGATDEAGLLKAASAVLGRFETIDIWREDVDGLTLSASEFVQLMQPRERKDIYPLEPRILVAWC
jgi:hypothetical protein